MTNQEGGPDFIVDQNGNVSKVNRQKHSQERTSPYSTRFRSVESSSRPQKKSNVKYYLIPIPVGLIILLFVWLISLVGNGSAGTHLNNAYASLQSGNYSQAITEYNKVLELEPDSRGAYLNRAIAYLAVGDYDKAIEDSDRAAEYFPEKASVFLHRGIAYSAVGEIDRAILDYDKAIQLDSNLAEAYFNRGLSYQELGYLDKALSDFDKAIEHAPELFFDIETTPDLDNGYRQLQILEYNSNPIHFGVDLPLTYVCRGLVHFQKSNFEQALSDFDKAIQLDPYLSKAYYYRGITSLAQGNIDDAIRKFEIVVELGNDPDIMNDAETYLNDLQGK
ncbi:MAG: tetratricopeptide repeat protein [Anaerolineae bacterium]